ncbi:MAG: EamA family transporter RarD [Chloroflexota bacterium]
MESDNRRGMLFGFMAYFLWGIFPIYFKLLHSVPAVQILGNRITWSFLLLSGVLLVRREWGAFRRSINSARLVALYLTAGLLLAVNWLIYIWGVNAGYIVETSLGYFINPLVNVLLGVIFLKERLRPAQWAPIALAAAGVTYLTINYGHLPWIAISLAVTFGLYGLAKKKSPLGSVFGLTLETGVLVLPAVAALLFWEVQGVGQLGHRGLAGDLLLAASGIITVIPLLLFGSAAQHPAQHAGAAAVHRPHAAVPDRRAGLPRAVQREPVDRVWPDLAGVGSLLDRRHAPPAAGCRRRLERRCLSGAARRGGKTPLLPGCAVGSIIGLDDKEAICCRHFPAVSPPETQTLRMLTWPPGWAASMPWTAPVSPISTQTCCVSYGDRPALTPAGTCTWSSTRWASWPGIRRCGR